ncbi:MAG: hypothetical protein ACI9EB_001820, partial [Pseudomonas sp.]
PPEHPTDDAYLGGLLMGVYLVRVFGCVLGAQA